jgi:NTP pyrophosphatase (non-canonical NTP hydrolase)
VTTDQWAILALQADWLDRCNGRGDHQDAMRLMKLAEEAGEVCRAYTGMHGQNPRKGTTHTRVDVADELIDVAVSALVALHLFTDDPQAAFEAKLAKIRARTVASEVSR